MTACRCFLASAVVLLTCFVGVIQGQRVSCSCDPAPGRTCKAVVTCPDGCTSLCGTGDSCYVSCRTDAFEPRVTMTFVGKTGEEIAASLSAKIRKRIQFTPFPKNKDRKYDLNLKNDDLFNSKLSIQTRYSAL